MTYTYNNVYIKDKYTIAGMYEKDGPLGKYFDKTYNSDLYMNKSSWEKAEIGLLREAIDKLLKRQKLKNSDIDLIISGDLSNQIAVSNYAIRGTNIPFLGVYNACATIAEAIIVAATFIDSKKIKNAIVATSSHNMSAEKQFRNPTEYGSPKPMTATFTATGGASVLLSNKPSKIRVVNGLIGTIVDFNQKDAFNMGAAMAGAAADTLYKYLTETNTKASDYDLILTGDLGKYGKEILKDLMLNEYNIDLSKNYNDCGTMLYDLEEQKEVMAGGSGPVCSALVNYSTILKNLMNNKYKKVLLIATGALFSPIMLYQKENILSIANLICLEAI